MADDVGFGPDDSKPLADDFGFGGLEILALDELGYDAFGGRGDGRISCFDLGSNKVWHEVQGVSTVKALVANGEKMQAVRGASNGILDVWDLNSGEGGKQLIGHSDNVVAINVDWVGNRAVTGSLDKNVIVWDLTKTIEVGRLKGHEGGVSALATSWAKGLVLSASHDETLRLWSLADYSLVGKLDGHSEAVKLLSADWDTMRALSVSEDRAVKLWDLKTFECTLTFEEMHESQVVALHVDWPSMQAMVVLADGIIHIWDLNEPANNPLADAFLGSSIKVATISPGVEGELGKPARKVRQTELAKQMEAEGLGR